MGRCPKISVVMPVYNAVPFLVEAIESILRQTFQDFEFIIVDDGSSDGSQDVMLDYEGRDSRIKVVLNEITLNTAGAMNRGMSRCRGEYLARMDHDDISLPERFQRQVEFMDKAADVGACGTWYRAFGAGSGTQQHPLQDAEIKICHLFHHSVIANPTAMLRRDILARAGIAYRLEDFPSEDAWFWIRLGLVTAYANLPEVLHCYRKHPMQMTQTRKAEQRVKSANARLFFASSILGRLPTATEAAAHSVLGAHAEISTATELARVADYGAALCEANAATKLVDQSLLRAVVKKRLVELPRKHAEQQYKYCNRFDMQRLSQFLGDPLRPLRSFDLNENLRFVLKCAIGHVPRERNN